MNPPSDQSAALETAIRAKRATVGVIGLGYVGLPLIRVFVAAGFRALGFDVDPAKVDKLRAGESYIAHIAGDWIAQCVADGTFEPTTDMRRLAEADCVLICVPTPLTESRDPNLSFVEGTARQIAEALRPGQLVVLESTTYPGTTRDVVLPILETAGYKVGRDFFLAFSPEREDPGNAKYTANTIPKVVGGIEPQSARLAGLLYGQAVVKVVPVSNCEVAEASKILENTYRAVNIALVNELKVLFDRMGIDVWEVIDAAATKPFGFQAFYPGPGLGGHCIPIDPFYLSWIARKHGLPTQFIELAGEINTAMPDYVVKVAFEALNNDAKAVKNARVLILGLAYKANVDDDRESPSYALLDLLAARGAEVAYHDPHVPVIKLTREHPHWAGVKSVKWNRKTIASFDAVLISTAHAGVNYRQLAAWSPLVVDTRNVMAGFKTPAGRIWKA